MFAGKKAMILISAKLCSSTWNNENVRVFFYFIEIIVSLFHTNLKWINLESPISMNHNCLEFYVDFVAIKIYILFFFIWLKTGVNRYETFVQIDVWKWMFRFELKFNKSMHFAIAVGIKWEM